MKKKKGLIFVMFHVLFDFCEVSHTRGHENQRKLKHLNFVKFHLPGFMKINKNPMLQFSLIFMTPGT